MESAIVVLKILTKHERLITKTVKPITSFRMFLKTTEL